jgi:hypothetical protein
MQEVKSTLTVNAGSAGAKQRTEAVQALLDGIAKRPDMRKAHEAWDTAAERFAFIRRRPDDLSAALKKSGAAVTKARQAFEDAVCVPGPIPTDVTDIAQAAALDKELARQLEILVCKKIPRAEIASLLSQAEYLECFAGELSKAAAERMKATLGALAPALLAEGSLSFDPTQTVSGQLQKRATRLLEEAEGLRQQAMEIRRKFKFEGEN